MIELILYTDNEEIIIENNQYNCWVEDMTDEFYIIINSAYIQHENRNNKAFQELISKKWIKYNYKNEFGFIQLKKINSINGTINKYIVHVEEEFDTEITLIKATDNLKCFLIIQNERKNKLKRILTEEI